MAAWTAFVYGDSYTSAGFSTRTGIYDSRTDTLVPTLETFAVRRDGKDFTPPDRNFWGVSFLKDDNTFYATLGSSSSGGTFLVRGDFAARTMTVLRENVECPSLSPDGTRLVFKKKISDDPSKPWRLYVLDLATLRGDRASPRPGSVDDQGDWLDNRTHRLLPADRQQRLRRVAPARGRLGPAGADGVGRLRAERGALSPPPGPVGSAREGRVSARRTSCSAARRYRA